MVCSYVNAVARSVIPRRRIRSAESLDGCGSDGRHRGRSCRRRRVQWIAEGIRRVRGETWLGGVVDDARNGGSTCISGPDTRR